MRNGMRRSAAAAVLSVATLALSACGGSSGDTEPTGQAAPKPPTSQSSEPSGPALAGVKPCDVFSSKQASKLGLKGPGEVSEFDESTCKWKMGGHDINVSVYKDKALTEINFTDAQKQPTKLSGRTALLAKENSGPGTCSLAFKVTDSSSVSVNSVSDKAGDTKTACEIVKKAAPMVEATIFGS